MNNIMKCAYLQNVSFWVHCAGAVVTADSRRVYRRGQTWLWPVLLTPVSKVWQ